MRTVEPAYTLMAYEMRRIIYNTITLDYANWDEDTEETAY